MRESSSYMNLALYFSMLPFVACLILYNHLESIIDFPTGLAQSPIHHSFRMELYSSTMASCHTYSALASSKLEGFASMIEDIKCNIRRISSRWMTHLKSRPGCSHLLCFLQCLGKPSQLPS
jgi:hypothetical protein